MLNAVRVVSISKKIGFKKVAHTSKKNPKNTHILFFKDNKNITKTIIISIKKIKLKELLKKRCVGENISTIELKKAIFELEYFFIAK
jgi:uncharacterized protein YqfB (UPF0267 family)